MREPQVDPDRLLRDRNGYLRGLPAVLDQNADEVPASRGSSDRRGLRLPCKPAVEDRLDRPDLGEFHGTSLEVYGVRLRYRERLLRAVLLLEDRFLRTTFEEVRERTSKVGDRLLQGLGVDLLEPGMLHLESRETFVEIVRGETHPVVLVSLVLEVQPPVVHEPATPKVLADQDSLILRRIQPVPSHHTILLGGTSSDIKKSRAG